MLKKVNPTENTVYATDARKKIRDCDADKLFESTLEYGAPARGTWNIVHTGMLIPNAHQIFVCASGCLRGVVLTAAEMGASDRFSTIEIKEHNLLDGSMETLIIDGVSTILSKLHYTPSAILLYTSCIHHFIGCDMNYVFSCLREKFPNVDFTDCYMNPIMRKSGHTPDQIMRKQLYSLLKEQPQNDNVINIIGNDFSTDESSELIKILKYGGFEIKEITTCNTYDEYQQMATAKTNITYYPAAKFAGDELKKQLNQKHMYIPCSFNLETIENHIKSLIYDFNINYEFDFETAKENVQSAINRLKSIIKDVPVAIDYTAVSRPFELALLLAENDINVTRIYADSVSAEDKPAFEKLKNISPDLDIYPTVHPAMRIIPRKFDGKILCIGQKAAYFTDSRNFVNMVLGGGHWGFDGIIRLCREIEDAFLNEKETSKLIQAKGLGCESCII